MQRDNHQFKVLVWHRKARKTTTAIYELIKQAHLKLGLYWHIFPTFTEGKDTVWRDPNMIFNFIPQELIARKNDAEGILYLKCGSVFQLKGGDDPDRLRGPGPLGVVFDEFGTMKLEAWEVIEPALKANDGWAWFIGTPKGKNHLYQFLQRGRDPKFTNWRSWLLTGDKSNIFTPQQLIELKQTMTQKMFSQEIMCDFLETEGTVFRDLRGAAISKPETPQPNEYYVMGVDLAKVTDYTVVTVYKRSTNSQVYQDRFNTLEWPFQKAKIARICQHYNKALCVIDATGIGDPIADDLSRIGVPVQPVKITEPLKKELIEKLSLYIEQRSVKLLPIDQTFLEFDNFSYEIGPTGKIRYQARQGFHDDVVISHALAVSELHVIPKTEIKKEDSLIHQAYLQQLGFNRDTRVQDEWND